MRAGLRLRGPASERAPPARSQPHTHTGPPPPRTRAEPRTPRPDRPACQYHTGAAPRSAAQHSTAQHGGRCGARFRRCDRKKFLSACVHFRLRAAGCGLLAGPHHTIPVAAAACPLSTMGSTAPFERLQGGHCCVGVTATASFTPCREPFLPAAACPYVCSRGGGGGGGGPPLLLSRPSRH